MGRRGLTALVCATLVVACSGGSATRSKDPSRVAGSADGGAAAGGERVVVDLVGARNALGSRVRVDGTAQNAKLAAAVVGDELLIYCLDRDSWPSDVVGTQVSVIGTIEWTEEFAAETSPNGEISAGTDGGVFVIRTCAPASTR